MTSGGTSSPQPPRRKRFRARWLILAMPFLVFGALIALAPGTPEPPRSVADAESAREKSSDGKAFHYLPDDEVYALDLDPRRVRFGLLEGWDREQDAFEDIAALAYVSGPMYERHVDSSGQEITVPLGDLKFGSKVWKGRNRTASRQRAFVGIRKDGTVDFGYGELTEQRSKLYDTFIGGLHSLYNDLEAPPESYKGAYSISMGQRIRYYLPRIRMVMGLREDGHLEILMSRDGLTLEQTKEMARRRGYLAAYMPDHASKSRFIIPGTKGFTEEDANWISGGATSFVHVPYLLRLSPRQQPLQGSLMADLMPRLAVDDSCEGAVGCVQAFSHHLADRALAGLNRVMEQGVEPLARMIWAPSTRPKTGPGGGSAPGSVDVERAPLREPPITADPLVLREQPGIITAPDEAPSSGFDDGWSAPENFAPLPPDLPPPTLLEEPGLNNADAPFDSSKADFIPDSDPTDDVDGLETVDAVPPPPELPPLPPAPLPPVLN